MLYIVNDSVTLEMKGGVMICGVCSQKRKHKDSSVVMTRLAKNMEKGQKEVPGRETAGPRLREESTGHFGKTGMADWHSQLPWLSPRRMCPFTS